jgi:S-adenosylmethionine-diacylglycerol 3-amino-3-carboxypropyl transferase
MTDAQLADLWQQITRTAKSGASVIFRTAAHLVRRLAVSHRRSSTGGNTSPNIRANCLARTGSIYGGFHLYLLKTAA